MKRSQFIFALLFMLIATSVYAATVKITIKGGRFAPGTVTIHPGDEVVWINDDDRDATVDAEDGSFSSPTLKAGRSYRHVFKEKGAVAYGSRLYPRMHGTVNVEEGK